MLFARSIAHPICVGDELETESAERPFSEVAARSDLGEHEHLRCTEVRDMLPRDHRLATSEDEKHPDPSHHHCISTGCALAHRRSAASFAILKPARTLACPLTHVSI